MNEPTPKPGSPPKHGNVTLPRVNLRTAEGAFVASAVMLPFQQPPAVMVWGSRVFQYAPATADYRECFAFAAVEAFADEVPPPPAGTTTPPGHSEQGTRSGAPVPLTHRAAGATITPGMGDATQDTPQQPRLAGHPAAGPSFDRFHPRHPEHLTIEEYLRTHAAPQFLHDLLAFVVHTNARMYALETWAKKTQQDLTKVRKDTDMNAAAQKRLDDALDTLGTQLGQVGTDLATFGQQVNGAITDLQNQINSDSDPAEPLARIAALGQKATGLSDQIKGMAIPTTAGGTTNPPVQPADTTVGGTGQDTTTGGTGADTTVGGTAPDAVTPPATPDGTVQPPPQARRVSP